MFKKKKLSISHRVCKKKTKTKTKLESLHHFLVKKNNKNDLSFHIIFHVHYIIKIQDYSSIILIKNVKIIILIKNVKIILY